MLERVSLVTGNPGKAREFADMLGVEVTPAKAELTEIQSLDVSEVVTRKAADAYLRLGEPVLVDDTGLSVHAWNGLPGALIVWWVKTVGPEGILCMAHGLADRRVTVTTALGYATAAGVQVFPGVVEGRLAAEPRGGSGFGWDSIFIPGTGDGRTYAEMTSDEKNQISHRRLAVNAMRAGLGLGSHTGAS